jgi:hypothetical protein
MAPRTLTERELNRAVLARQLLLDRSTLTIEQAVEQVGGLQTQYAPSGYVGLWTRLADFPREALTTALEDRMIIQASLMRNTIHMVSRRDFWRYALAVRKPRRDWALRLQPRGHDEGVQLARAEELRAALSDGPRTVKELGELGAGFVGNLGVWVDLVRVPPSGTWARRRADRLALAQDWVGPCDTTEEQALTHLVTAYIGAFGPARWRDVASWSGLSVAEARHGARDLALVYYRDEQGGELVDLTDAPLPPGDTPAPVRFLPHWEATLLVHARRTGILPEAHRPRIFNTKLPFSVGTYLVDGRVAGGWSLRDGRIQLDPFEPLPSRAQAAVEREREALEAFHAGT